MDKLRDGRLRVAMRPASPEVPSICGSGLASRCGVTSAATTGALAKKRRPGLRKIAAAAPSGPALASPASIFR
jgi:hypothetical protein